jgi:hypothetical protein
MKVHRTRIVTVVTALSLRRASSSTCATTRGSTPRFHLDERFPLLDKIVKITIRPE